MLTQRPEPRGNGELTLPNDPARQRPAGSRDNYRAIELSEKGHVELVLYARGLELERDRLLELIRSVQERLAALTKTRGVSPQVHEGIQELVNTLEKYL